MIRRTALLLAALLLLTAWINPEPGGWGTADEPAWGVGEEMLHAFSTTWKTDNVGTSDDDQITLPLVSSGAIDFTVYWGDGTSDHITAYDDAAVTHTYPAAGTYDVKITGTIKGWQFNNGGDKLKILDISEWGVLDISTSGAFYGCTNLDVTATDAPTVSTLSFLNMFRNCEELTNIGNVSGYSFGSVNSMQAAFYEAKKFNQDLSSLDVSSVTTMLSCFYRNFLLDQSFAAWNINAVTVMTNMFTQAENLSVANYSATLIGWAAGGHAGNPTLSTVTPAYSLEAAAARAELVADGWTITDGGCELGVIVDWWRIEDGLTDDGGGLISKWEGSINSIDLDAAGDARPTWTADQINGQPALVFDNTVPNYIKGSFGSTLTQPNTIILVSSEPKDTGVNRNMYYGDVLNKIHRIYFNSVNTDFLYAGTYQTTEYTYEATETFKIWSAVYNRASSLLRVNGTNYAVAGDVGDHVLTGFTLGASDAGGFPSGISVTDVIVIDGALDATQLGIVETYLDDLRGGIIP